MNESNNIQLFEDKRIRTAWDEEEQEWYFVKPRLLLYGMSEAKEKL